MLTARTNLADYRKTQFPHNIISGLLRVTKVNRREIHVIKLVTTSIYEDTKKQKHYDQGKHRTPAFGLFLTATIRVFPRYRERQLYGS